MRKTALEDIGGFPTGTLAEDVACSSLLLGKGWKTAYVHEELQFGGVPDSYAGHIKQRTRWVSRKDSLFASSLANLGLDNRYATNRQASQLLPVGRKGQADDFLPAHVECHLYPEQLSPSVRCCVDFLHSHRLGIRRHLDCIHRTRSATMAHPHGFSDDLFESRLGACSIPSGRLLYRSSR